MRVLVVTRMYPSKEAPGYAAYMAKQVPPDDIEGIRDAIASLYKRWQNGQLDVAVAPDEVRQFAWPLPAATFAATREGALAPSAAPDHAPRG